MDYLPAPGLLFTMAMFVAMIGPLVFVHELGHYLAGRVFRTKTESFSIGFGREIFGWTDRRGMRWKLGWLPLGGYVKFAGDANPSGLPGDVSGVPASERGSYLQFKPVWQRAIIAAAGPFTNFFAALMVFAAFIAIYGQVVTPPIVSKVLPNSPAAVVGIEAGDRIVSIGGKSIDTFEDIVAAVMVNPGMAVEVQYIRGDTARTAELMPDMIEERDRFGNTFTIPRIGLAGEERSIVERSPIEAVYYGGQAVYDTTVMMIEGLGQVITGRRSVKELGGPLKIAEVSGQAGAMGPEAFVNLMALISINLGFINLLPIPMLDGGHLAIYAVEAMRRKPVPQRVQEWAFMTGFALLVSFMLLVTWNDLASFGVFKHVAGLIG